MRLVIDDPNEGSQLLVLEERQTPLSAGSLESLGLTQRESQILVYAARGINEEIAASHSQPAYRQETPRACLRKAGGRKPHRGPLSCAAASQPFGLSALCLLES